MSLLKTLTLSQNLPIKFLRCDLQSTQNATYHMEVQANCTSANKMHTDLPAVIPVSRNLLVEESHIANGFIYPFLTFSTCRRLLELNGY